MSDSSLGSVWARINIWQKILVVLFGVIWIGISAWIVTNTNRNVILDVVGVGTAWIGYIALAYGITRDYRNAETPENKSS